MLNWHLIFQDDDNGLRVFANEDSFVFHHKNENGRWRKTTADAVDWFLLAILLLEDKYNDHVCAEMPTDEEISQQPPNTITEVDIAQSERE